MSDYEVIPDKDVFADERLSGFCIYCGGDDSTKDHTPSKAMLDKPHPPGLPVVPACHGCNNNASLDEQYVAALIECARVGGTDPDTVERSWIRRAFTRRPAIEILIRETLASCPALFPVEDERVHRVLLMLAKGHASHEMSSPLLEEPTSFACVLLDSLGSDARAEFETPLPSTLFVEIGSRAMQRQVMGGGPGAAEWIVIQVERYRYLCVAASETLTVRIVLSEYLACEVVWSEGEY